MKVVSGTQMREIEASLFASGVTPEGLMEAAGKAVSDSIQHELGGARARRVVFLIGPGNNGGDGLIAARHLHETGAEVTVYLLAPRSAEDGPLTGLLSAGGEVSRIDTDSSLSSLAEDLIRADLIVDAIFGTGKLRPLKGSVASVSRLVNEGHTKVFSIDLPSGVDADSGATDPASIRADVTFALGVAKVGTVSWPGSSHAGLLRVLEIGLPERISDTISSQLLTEDRAVSGLPSRPGDSNKGSFGRVLLVAGSNNYTGAPILASLGAFRTGAGLVTLASAPKAIDAARARLPEITYLPLPAAADGGLDEGAGDEIVRALAAFDSLLIGPGLGQSPTARSLVRGLLAHPDVGSLPVIIDADALNCLAAEWNWPSLLPANCVLTPHPGEFGRLSRTRVTEVQADRLGQANRAAIDWGQTVVLKGAHSVVVTPAGELFISPFVNPALATAGTGDVLAGMIAGFAAQGVDPGTAACLGTYVHGAAAGEFEDSYGASGLLASELGQAVAKVIAALRRQGDSNVRQRRQN